MAEAGQGEPIDRVIARIRAVYGGWRRNTAVEQMRHDWDALFWSNRITCTTEDVVADGVAVRWITTPGARDDRVLIYFHGGGFKMGSVVSHQDLMARVSLAAGCRVLGVSYRMLPEHCFPAPIEDAVAVYRWTLAQGMAPACIALAGDSAGGGMVASTLMALRDAGDRLPAAGVMLSAWTDLEAQAPSYETRAAADPIHQRPMILALAQQYLGADGDARNPLASPLHGDLRGLPPLLLQVGDCETGLDDSTLFVDKARRAGVQAELQVWDRMIHVFQQFPDDLPEARQAIEKIGQFLQCQWSAAG